MGEFEDVWRERVYYKVDCRALWCTNPVAMEVGLSLKVFKWKPNATLDNACKNDAYSVFVPLSKIISQNLDTCKLTELQLYIKINMSSKNLKPEFFQMGAIPNLFYVHEDLNLYKFTVPGNILSEVIFKVTSNKISVNLIEMKSLIMC